MTPTSRKPVTSKIPRYDFQKTPPSITKVQDAYGSLQEEVAFLLQETKKLNSELDAMILEAKALQKEDPRIFDLFKNLDQKISSFQSTPGL